MRRKRASQTVAIKAALLIIIGFANGIIVGAGFVAFLIIFGIVPRLMQLTKTSRFVRAYEWSITSGAVIGGWLGLRGNGLDLSGLWLIPIGLASGIFIGMLAAALTEVLNVLPILAKRIGIDEEKIVMLLMALVLGKIIGSLIQWTYFVDL
ncbi:MAG TPA: stage V sporulation protein AB [Bacillales bacterium]|nr:stage V sporulation protein AB [Bacillales bacterium]